MGEQAEKDVASAEVDAMGQAEIEGRTRPADGGSDGKRSPTAGPHAAPALTNPEATPGAGSLPSAAEGDEAAAATG